MVRDRAPFVVRHPGPTEIGVDPVAVRVRMPVDHLDAGDPDAPVATPRRASSRTARGSTRRTRTTSACAAADAGCGTARAPAHQPRCRATARARDASTRISDPGRARRAWRLRRDALNYPTAAAYSARSRRPSRLVSALAKSRPFTDEPPPSSASVVVLVEVVERRSRGVGCAREREHADQRQRTSYLEHEILLCARGARSGAPMLTRVCERACSASCVQPMCRPRERNEGRGASVPHVHRAERGGFYKPRPLAGPSRALIARARAFRPPLGYASLRVGRLRRPPCYSST